MIGIKHTDTIEGLGGNLKYYSPDFVSSESTDKNKHFLAKKSTEMLCLKENCFDEIINNTFFKIFANSSNYLGIIYDDKGIDSFKEEVKKLNKNITTYIFSLDDSTREEEFEDLMHLVNLKPIPEAILNVYRRIFK